MMNYARRSLFGSIAACIISCHFVCAVTVLSAAEKTTVSSSKTDTLVIPEPKLSHLKTLTDDTGIFEHATYTTPNRKNGYCTEDVARALAAVLMYNRHIKPGDETAAALAGIYIKYLKRAQMKNGNFYHRMDFAQHSHGTATEDSYGRALWGLGYAAAYPVDSEMGSLAREIFQKALPRAKTLGFTRSMAYAMLGLHYYLERFPESDEVRAVMESLADRLVSMYKKNSSGDWPWFEDTLTYDNAKMPHVLFLAYEDSKNKEFLDTAGKTLDFLIKVSFPKEDMLQIIGNKGWYQKGGRPALYDQQPTDAAAMVEACAEAYRVTGLSSYKEKARLAFEWFLGNNIAGKPIYDAASGGSRDGLNESGINENEGAESSIAVVNSLITIRTVLDYK
ncbi:MAG: hypothetical protein ABIG11_01400 [bacterium]